MAFAAVFMVRQRDFKRMLAYSSVEHMGILVIGLAVGGLATYGAFLHMINNGSPRVSCSSLPGTSTGLRQQVHRACQRASAGYRSPPRSSSWVPRHHRIPPFGPFVSEFTIVRGTVQAGHFAVAIAFFCCSRWCSSGWE